MESVAQREAQGGDSKDDEGKEEEESKEEKEKEEPKEVSVLFLCYCIHLLLHLVNALRRARKTRIQGA